jgi:IS30 family transposase
MTGPKPVGRPWTRAEEKQLQDMLDAGMTAGEAATKLERTRQSIYARLQRIYRKRVKPSVFSNASLHIAS